MSPDGQSPRVPVYPIFVTVLTLVLPYLDCSLGPELGAQVPKAAALLAILEHAGACLVVERDGARGHVAEDAAGELFHISADRLFE